MANFGLEPWSPGAKVLGFHGNPDKKNKMKKLKLLQKILYISV